MRIETNQKLIKRNTQFAQYLFFFSMGVLVIGFLVTNQQLLGVDPTSDAAVALSLLVPSIILPIGLVTTLVSVRMTNLWIRRPRPEVVLEEGLKGLGNKSVLYNYYHFPARHVLICPQGVFAIITRYQDGQHSVNGSTWRTQRSALSRFFSIFRLDGLGDPNRDAQQAARHVQSKLQAITPEVEVQPIILFVDSRVQLEINDPIVPVLHVDTKIKPNLKDYLRDLKSFPEQEETTGKKGAKKSKEVTVTPMPLSPEQIEAFEAATLPR